jgi:hypothetical protein
MISIMPIARLPTSPHWMRSSISSIPWLRPRTAGVNQTDAARAITVFAVFSVIASSLLLLYERHRSCHAISAWDLAFQFKNGKIFTNIEKKARRFFLNMRKVGDHRRNLADGEARRTTTGDNRFLS